jgi:hypothetical protein
MGVTHQLRLSAEGLQQALLFGERQQLHPRNGQQLRQEILSRLYGRLASADLNANRFQTHLVAACCRVAIREHAR